MPSTPPSRATNAELKLLRSLLRDKHAREETKTFVAEGPRVVDAALRAGAKIVAVYVDDAGVDVAVAAATAGIEVRVVEPDEARRIGGTTTPQPVFATIELARPGLAALTGASLCIVGTQVNDPGNAGTLMRSAAAAGATALGLGARSVDAYNPKVVRASAGACFAIATVEGLDAVEMLEALGDAGVQRVGAAALGGRTPEALDLTVPTAFVLGHETRGLSSDLPLDALVTIPMHAAESLNVAMAGTVLLFEAARQRRQRA